jgi:hypothetical protein
MAGGFRWSRLSRAKQLRLMEHFVAGATISTFSMSLVHCQISLVELMTAQAHPVLWSELMDYEMTLTA